MDLSLGLVWHDEEASQLVVYDISSSCANTDIADILQEHLPALNNWVSIVGMSLFMFSAVQLITHKQLFSNLAQAWLTEKG